MGFPTIPTADPETPDISEQSDSEQSASRVDDSSSQTVFRPESAIEFPRANDSMFWSPWNPYPIQASMGLRDDVLATPLHTRNMACFDQRAVPAFYSFRGTVLQRVIGGLDRSAFEVGLSYKRMTELYGATGQFFVDEWYRQEFCWNRSGTNRSGADRMPALWEEVGFVDRLIYDPGLNPEFIEGDKSYQVSQVYTPGETVTHINTDNNQLARWRARDVNGDGSEWKAGEFNRGQWDLDRTGAKQSPRWFFAAGVAHFSAQYRDDQLPVTHRTWSLWQHSKIPWDPAFDPYEHHDEDFGGYPVYATEELRQAENANILESPQAMQSIRVKGRNESAVGSFDLVPHWL